MDDMHNQEPEGRQDQKAPSLPAPASPQTTDPTTNSHDQEQSKRIEQLHSEVEKWTRLLVGKKFIPNPEGKGLSSKRFRPQDADVRSPVSHIL